ncbi:MAG: N-acetylmuramoyl-L-alanine amidase [Bacteroidales bacterium]|nr:N-acetylmuramoyl-L-alanine amidase [Bacteroidales bacterium]
MLRKGLRDKDYREDLILWVPWEWLNCLASDAKPPDHPENEPATRIFPIFGRDNEQVTVTDSRLKGIVFYVVAGHGGPDPGAIGKYKGHSLCEDEYAYDISLRLACNLIGHDATVYIIIQDPDDGIREGAVLKCDKDETCRENQKIPVSQMPRLKQRCDAVNSLYTEHRKKGNIRQYVLILHVDSRSTGQRIDMFFYHHEKSSEGKRIAGALRDMIREKYDIHQKSRGYSGTVSPRNLYMIRNTKPVAVYAELGNIRNSLDQRRFVIADNRQAVANWIAEGLLKALSK